MNFQKFSKKPYRTGGDYGYRGEKINELISKII